MKSSKKASLLGAYTISYDSFPNLDGVFQDFHAQKFRALSHRKRFETLNKTLLDLCLQAKEPCFLLPALIEFLAKVNNEKILSEPFRLLHFEFWLNHYSQLSEDDNRSVRAKIVGKKIPRDEYQLFFPIGQNKTFAGSHFVAAHLSPDVDTTIASFWGWVDAFGSRVANGIHQWSLPGQVTDAQITHLFESLFSKTIFENVVRQTQALTLTALDLVSKNNILKLSTSSYSSQISHLQLQKAIILVDEDGHFKGDWRAIDSEAVRQVVLVFYSLIRWLENTIQAQIISVLAKKNVHQADLQKAVGALFSLKIASCELAKEFTDQQKAHQSEFLTYVLGLPNGLKSTFRELIDCFKEKIPNIAIFETLQLPALFDSKGKLVEDRSKIFCCLENIFSTLNISFQAIRDHVDRFDLLLEVKEKVLGIKPQYITLKSDVDEIRTKMNGLEHLCVVIPEEKGHWFPVGVVYAKEIQREVLGTVSLRDFSNEGETKMASYLQVISVIDHHKSEIKTSSASTIVVGDAQSANTLVAELTLMINERYSTLGIAAEKIQRLPSNTKDLATLKRLLQLKMNAQHTGVFFIHPKREYSEYLLFLNAILDDTDLLTKVSRRDLECVAKLLNRMKSIAIGQDLEIISFDSLKRDEQFTTNAARLILQNNDMYSIYKQIYEFKEREVATTISECVQGRSSTFFADTKVQNGCSRVGQTKLFSSNYPLFATHSEKLRSIWIAKAQKIHEATPQVDLHMQMISTIASADEVHKGLHGSWQHQDELWIWTPPTQAALERLVSFLNNFHATGIIDKNNFQVELSGPNAKELATLFGQNFSKAEYAIAPNTKKGSSIAVIKYKAGLINSRKAIITPCLPRLLA